MTVNPAGIRRRNPYPTRRHDTLRVLDSEPETFMTAQKKQYNLNKLAFCS